MENFRKTESMVLERPRNGNVVGLRNAATMELFELTPERSRWMIGSEPSCDLTIDDPFVSRTHCTIERRASGSVLVKDQGSRNGTFVRTKGALELYHGDYLFVGQQLLRVEIS